MPENPLFPALMRYVRADHNRLRARTEGGEPAA